MGFWEWFGCRTSSTSNSGAIEKGPITITGLPLSTNNTVSKESMAYGNEIITGNIDSLNAVGASTVAATSLVATSDMDAQQQPNTRFKPNYAVLGGAAAVFVGFTWLAFPFISPAFRKHCLPYVPATEKQIDMVLKMRSK